MPLQTIPLPSSHELGYSIFFCKYLFHQNLIYNYIQCSERRLFGILCSVLMSVLAETQITEIPCLPLAGLSDQVVNTYKRLTGLKLFSEGTCSLGLLIHLMILLN